MIRSELGRRTRHFGLALCAALLTAGATAAPGQAATISGTVANDYNANGVRDTTVSLGSAVDGGLAGVTVTAYSSSGSQLGASVVSGPAGTYSLTVPDGSGPVRVEFTGLPAGYNSGPFGVDNGTSVQFVTVPTGVNPAVTNVNFGAAVPEDFCSNNPLLVTCRFSFGASDFDGGNEAVVAFRPNFGAAVDDDDPPAGKVVLATKGDVGAVNGEAVDPRTGDVFVAAFLKGHTGFGPAGIGGIYRIPASAASTTGFNPVGTFVTVSGVGANSHDTGDYARDASSFPTIGRRGLGDIEVGPDGTTLYAVNLATNSLVPVPLSTPAGSTIPTTAQIAIPSPCAGAAEWHAMGLGKHRGLLYVGGVCTNEAAGTVTAVVRSFNPATGVFSAPVLTTPDLTTFSRKCADKAGNASESDGTNSKANNCPTATAPARIADWHAWSDSTTRPSTLITSEAPTINRLDVVAYAQPMVGTISFDGDDLLLGMRDRWGDQLGKNAFTPNPADNSLVTGVGAGDLYRACRTGGVGNYTLESNGACLTKPATGGANDNEGPGGGEFFFGDDAQPHDQTFMGSATKLAGYRDVQATAFDPIFNLFEQGGVVWNDGTAGGRTTQLRVYDDSRGAFGKANGLGDLEAICTSAPLQIGNRVFRDTDRDGIQDAGETPISGVTVQLFQGTTLVGSTTTNGQGQYLFGNVAGNPLTLLPNTAYTVRIPTNQPTINGLQASPTAAGLIRTIDSNGAVVGGVDTAAVTTGNAGENDHSVDFGFFPARYDLALRKTTTASLVQIGDVVPFTITVFNQSPDQASVAQDIDLIDQIPAGFELADANWTAGPNRTATRTLPGPLAPGGLRRDDDQPAGAARVQR